MEHLFVFGFIILLTWAMEATFPTGTKGIKRY